MGMTLGQLAVRYGCELRGDPDSVVKAGQRVCNRTINEDDAGPLESHLVDWIE